MRMIVRIAKTELQSLFYSPIAWFVLVVFAFQCGLAFMESFESMVRSQVLEETVWRVSFNLFGYGLLQSVLNSVYLYMPLLTMGLMSRELSSGSVKLLYSSPVKSSQIVLGKFGAMMVFGLVLMAILSLFVFVAFLTVKNFEWPTVLNGLVGIYLLICAYAAIGLFMSCLMSYQVAVAVCTLALLAILNFIGTVGQEIAFVREITYWLSISGRANHFLNGLLSSDDVVYFFMVIILFLVLSIMKLQSAKQHRRWYVQIGRYGCICLLTIGCGYISSRPSMKKYYDMTFAKDMTLTLASQEIVKQLNGGLTITTYVNLMDLDNADYALPKSIMFDIQRFEQYIRFKPETKLRYVYYYCDVPGREISEKNLSLEERARKVADAKGLNFSQFLSPEEIQKEIDLSSENYTFVRLIERENGNKTFLRIYDDVAKLPGEAEISAALKKLTGNLPKVAFLTGHGERSIKGHMKRDYSFFADSKNLRAALVNQGFDVMTLDLSTCEHVPSDVHILVIADMNRPLDSEEFKKIESYVLSGGNVVLACEPGRQEIMNPLAKLLGVTFKTGYIVAKNKELLPNFIMGNITPEARSCMPQLEKMAINGGIVSIPGPVGIYYFGENFSNPFSQASATVPEEQVKFIPLLTSPAFGSWNKVEEMNLFEDSLKINPRIGEKEQSNILALAVSKKVADKEQRAIILGDADMWSNGELKTTRRGVPAVNFSFITETFRWLAYGEVPVNVSRPLPKDNEIYFDFEFLGWLYVLFLGVFPIVLIVGGLRMWRLRSRR